MEVKKIPLAKITPAIDLRGMKHEKNVRKKYVKFKSIYCLPLFVEKQEEEKYLLIGGYQDYYACKETLEENDRNILLPCIVINTTITRKERLLIVFRYLLVQSRLNNLDKHVIFVQLRKHIPLESIANEIGLNLGEVINSIYHPNIPIEYKKSCHLNRVLILNKIENIDIELVIKENLYRFAILKDDDPNRLTYEKLMCFCRLLTIYKHKLGGLTTSTKLEVLKNIINTDVSINKLLNNNIHDDDIVINNRPHTSNTGTEFNLIPISIKNPQKQIMLKLNKKIIIS